MTGFDHKAFLRTLTHSPGVYRMLGAGGELLYVGKARDLKKRVASYFRRSGVTTKVQALVAQIAAIEVTATHTEGEALLLESNLIKAHRPRYNVLLRDDKSYPYIHLSEGPFPRLSLYRGSRQAPGRYFGPYPSAVAVRDSLNLLQKLFPVRQCEDTFFRSRSRPCLQYQIKRCTAPCVGLVSEAAYAEDVRHALLFLEGRSGAVIDELAERMEAASTALEFEQAARYRDQIASLRRVQERQYVSGETGDLDVVAVALEGGVGCVQVFTIRGGRNLGNRTFYPRNTGNVDEGGLLGAFLSQYYGGGERPVPGEILVSHPCEEAELLEAALGADAGRRVAISHRLRGERRRWVELAATNARIALTSHLGSRASQLARLQALQEALGLDELPRRIECFDISHTAGEATVAACVVFVDGEPCKADYRRFNIREVAAGDDYAALAQALERRYTRLREGEGPLPDVLLIDGGKGQLGVVERLFAELQINGVVVLGLAKGESRRHGEETLFLSTPEEPLILTPAAAAMHLLRQIDDEAHRFAITGHRQRRGKARTTSVLESIPGLGPKRRRELLRQFGGLQEVARAGVDDLARVPGISRPLARLIYDQFHPDGERA